MKTIYLIIATLIALAVFGGAAWADPDPGLPDTVKIEGGPLAVGQSIPLTVTIVNDESISSYVIPLLVSTIDGGFAKFDSIVYLNRMADPNVLQLRYEVPKDDDGVSPDKFIFAAEKNFGSPLAPDNTPVFKFFFTGLQPGIMKLDTIFIPPSNDLYFILAVPACPDIHPQFQSLQVQVLEGRLPPNIIVPETPFRSIVGAEIGFEVSAGSPDGSPVTLQILSTTEYDDTSLVPDAAPGLGSGNPAEFSWTPAANDIGIWKITFRACDTAGLCTDRSVVIQTVSDDRFLVPYAISEMHDPSYAMSVTHGDFDDDGASELVVGGLPDPDSSAILFDWTSPGIWTPVFGLAELNLPFISPQPGYSNSDANLDIVAMLLKGYDNNVAILVGDGNNGFSFVHSSNDGMVTRSITLGEFTGDQYLDVAATWYSGIGIFACDGQNGYTLAATIPTADSALSINSADFNGDGFDDLAVGTVTGIATFLSDGQGGFTLANSYSQAYGSKEIEVTNKGSDFNNDNIFDLCISTPSIGGVSSEMVEYLGDGDGSFTQQVVRTVQGQIYGNCVGDFNGDGNLDIGYVNGARRYFAILFGDGDGSFTNELRWDLPGHTPQVVDCFDIDLDGDLDVVVAANGPNDIDPDNAVFTLLSQRDPQGFEKHVVTLSARDNAGMELVSAGGKVLNRVRNTMPSGSYFRRNLDQDGAIDDFATVSVVESGQYTLTARPKPNLPAEEPFTLEFTLDGRLFRLAKDVPMNAIGYDFTIFPGNGSAVLPIPGAFIEVNPPSFAWSGKGEYDFQLATDIDFTDLIIDAVVSGNSYTLSTPLALADTATFYWRVKAHNVGAYDCRYVVNMVPSSGATCGDINSDGMVNIGDAVFLIVYIFRGGPAPIPAGAGDFNCDEAINVGDAVYLITYIFKGGPTPCCQ